MANPRKGSGIDMTHWAERHIQDAERQITWARAHMPPGQIGAVPLRTTTEIEACGSADYPDVPLEMLGDRPVIHYDDRHRRMEDDFNALVGLELNQGRITQDTADRAMANFHDYARATHLLPPHTSPRFYQ